MKTFEDLKFEPHKTGNGLMARLFFPNGYGVSVVRFKLAGPHFSRESEKKIFEVLGEL